MSRPRLDAEQKKVSFSLAFSPNLIAALEKVRGTKSQSVFVEEWLRQHPQIAAELAAMNDPGFVPPVARYERLMELLLAFYWPEDGKQQTRARILWPKDVKQRTLAILFTLNLMGLLGKQSQTVQERVEPLSRPSAKATEEGHAGLGAVGAARAATDFARNDQRADTALGQIVVRRHLWSRDKDEQFG